MQHLLHREINSDLKPQHLLTIRTRNKEKTKLHSYIRESTLDKQPVFPQSLNSFKERFSSVCVDWT